MKKTPISKQYWHIGPVYVKKNFLLGLIAAGSLLVLETFGFPREITDLLTSGPPIYRYDDPALLEQSDPIRIRDRNGVIRYEGPVEKGECTGVGKVYDASGDLCYEGPLVENRYEGSDAKVYEMGRLIYSGDMKNNRYEGEGKLLDPNTGRMYEGTFQNGLLEGVGNVYDRSGRFLYMENFHQGIPIGSEEVPVETPEP